jgi:hypothetical protein
MAGKFKLQKCRAEALAEFKVNLWWILVFHARSAEFLGPWSEF